MYYNLLSKCVIRTIERISDFNFGTNYNSCLLLPEIVQITNAFKKCWCNLHNMLYIYIYWAN